jgi:hypothetical protein
MKHVSISLFFNASKLQSMTPLIGLSHVDNITHTVTSDPCGKHGCTAPQLAMIILSSRDGQASCFLLLFDPEESNNEEQLHQPYMMGILNAGSISLQT